MDKVQEKDLSSILEIIDSIASIIVTDSQGYFTYVNDSFCALMEYKREELVGQQTRMLKSGVHSAEFYQELWATLLSGKKWRGKFCNKTKSGKLVWLDTVLAPSLNSEGKIEKFIGVRFNVTEEVSNELLLKQQEKQLDVAAKLATIGEISGYIAHEINNPLTIMTFAISSLKAAVDVEKPDPIKLRKLHEKMETVNARMTKIAQALRNFARNDTNSRMEPIGLQTLLDDILIFTGDIIKTDCVDFEIENNAEELVIECHKNQISQVLINLIKNACDAVRPYDHKEIKLKLNFKDDILEIIVEDSGPKIPPSIASHFFTPYYTTKAEGKGTGIGLTISQKIIDVHGGKIYFDSNADRTSFVVLLPKNQSLRQRLTMIKTSEIPNLKKAA